MCRCRQGSASSRPDAPPRYFFSGITGPSRDPPFFHAGRDLAGKSAGPDSGPLRGGHMRGLVLGLCCLVLGGCISVPPAPARQEWEEIHTRSFAGKSPREVLDAAEKVLRAADHDFTFDYPTGKLIGTRRWTVYAVLMATGGTDYWTIETQEADGATQASVMITRQVMAVMPSPTFNPGASAGWGVQSSTTPGTPLQARAAYDLFWDRVDSILDGSPWPTCEDRKRAIARRDRGGLDALCSVTTDDETPG